MHDLYRLVREYGMMFQMHPSEIGPTVMIVMATKDAKHAYELCVDEETWNRICDSDNLEFLFEKARILLEFKDGPGEQQKENSIYLHAK